MTCLNMLHLLPSFVTRRVLILTVCVLTLLLLVARLVEGVPVPGEVSQIRSAQDQWITHMCNAQCDAFCHDNEHCLPACRENVTESWIFTCQEYDEEVKVEHDEEKLSGIVTRKSECSGSCSTLLTYLRSHNADDYFYIPPKPVPVLVRDLARNSVTVSWTKPVTSHTIMYVVQESVVGNTTQFSNWSTAHVLNGDSYEVTGDFEACSYRKFRVAAVSQYGSYWFSDEVTTPDMVPASPRHFHVRSMWFNEVTREFNMTLQWESPTAWTPHNLIMVFNHTWYCPPSLDPVELEEENYVLSNFEDRMIVRIPEDAVGCRLLYSAKAVSKCRHDLYSERTWLTVDFGCLHLKDIYTGIYCTPPPFNPPGNPEIADVRTTPGLEGQGRAIVTWLRPEDLGSAGTIGFYTVFYGPFEDQFAGFLQAEALTVSNDTLQVDIEIPPIEEGKHFGVLVMAGAPGQVIEQPLGLIFDVDTRSYPGEVLLADGGVVVYRQPDILVDVQVYWPYPVPHPDRGTDVSRVAVQWGRVDRRRADDDPDDPGEDGGGKGGGGGGKDGRGVMTTAGEGQRGPGYTLPKTHRYKLLSPNTTVVHPLKNETYVLLQDLELAQEYGIQVRVILEGEEEDENVSRDDDWQDVPVHVFTLPPGQQPPAEEPYTAYTPGQPASDTISDTPQSPLLAVAVVIPLLVVVTSVMGLLLWWRWRRSQKLEHLIKMEGAEFRPYTYFSPPHGDEMDGDSHVVADEWELPHSCLKIGPVLGSGAFGQVYLGRVSRAMLRHRGLPLQYSALSGSDGEDGGDCHMAPVAIKMLKEGCEENGKAEFLREIRLMKDLGHHNHVVSMLGCCTLREPYCLLVEHMARGDLLSYLKEIRSQINATTPVSGHYQNHEAAHISPLDLLRMARQIALGMEFLSDKGYVHRDLAARNVLVGTNRQVKVGDFGLARYVYTDQIYVNRKGGKLPLKWMAVEAIFDLTFSTASDVWSFGVVLFEIVTLGGTPYPTIPVRDLLKALKMGYRMERPDNCSEELYHMMRACWRLDPSERPTFTSLRDWLEAMIADCSGVEYLDLTLNPERDYYRCHGDSSDSSLSDLDAQETSDNKTIRLQEEVRNPERLLHDRLRTCVSPDSGPSAVDGDSGGSALSTPKHMSLTSDDLDLGTGEHKVELEAVVHREFTPSESDASATSTLTTPAANSPTQSDKNTEAVSSEQATDLAAAEAEDDDDDDRGNEADTEDDDAEDDDSVNNEVGDADDDDVNDFESYSGEAESWRLSPGVVHDPAWDDVFEDLEDRDRLTGNPLSLSNAVTTQSGGSAGCQRHPAHSQHWAMRPNETCNRTAPRIVTTRPSRLGSQGESTCTSSSSGESVRNSFTDDLTISQYSLTTPLPQPATSFPQASKHTQPVFTRFPVTVSSKLHPAKSTAVNPRLQNASQRELTTGQSDSGLTVTSASLCPGYKVTRVPVVYSKKGVHGATPVNSQVTIRSVTGDVSAV